MLSSCHMFDSWEKLQTFLLYLQFSTFFFILFLDMIGNPLFDLENNLPDELFSTSGGGWSSASTNVSQPTAQSQQQQPPQQQQCVQRPQSMGPNNPGMGMSMSLGPGAQQQQNGSMDAQHHHQLPHMGMQNKASLNNMSGGAISGSAIGQNNLNMANSSLNKGALSSKLNSPPGSAPMTMMNSMGNGPQMMQSMQQQQSINNMLNPAGMGGVNVSMKTPGSMMNAGQMSQSLHNGPQAMMGNPRPVGGLPSTMMPQQQQAPLRGQLLQGMNPQGPRLQVKKLIPLLYTLTLDLNEG